MGAQQILKNAFGSLMHSKLWVFHEFVITLFRLCHIVLFLQIVLRCRCVVHEPAIFCSIYFMADEITNNIKSCIV